MVAILPILFVFVYLLYACYLGYNIHVWLQRAYAVNRKKTILLLAISLACLYPIGTMLSFVPFQIIGGYWMVLMAYGIIVFPIINLVYFLCKKKGVKLLGYIVTISYICLFVIGTFNAWMPTVKTYNVTIQKESDVKNLTILMASDFHLNDVIKTNHLQRFVALSEEVNPDIILLPGDIIDNEIAPYLEHRMGETMKQINAPLGVYATMGNHENYGRDIPVIIEEFKKAGITVLEDEVVLIEDAFYLIGRKDYQDKDRASVKELIKGVDKEKPIFMLEHQPVELDIAKENDVDLMVSGHTHRGQLYPGHLITEMLFENAYGYLQKENLHSIVSSGFGLWGPPLRIGSRSEVVIINVRFE